MKKQMFSIAFVTMLFMALCAGCEFAPDYPQVTYPTLERAATPTSVLGTLLTFNSLASISQANYEGSDPIAVLVREEEDLGKLAELFPEQEIETYWELAHSKSPNRSLLGVFRGQKQDSGYAVTIDRLILGGNVIYVYTRACDNLAPGSAAEARVTSYSELVEVEVPSGTAESLDLQVILYPVNC